MATIGEGVIKVKSDTSGFGGELTSALGSVGKVASQAFTIGSTAAIAFGVSAFSAAARVGEMDATLRALSKGNEATYATMQKTVSAIRSSGIEAGVAQNLVAQFTRNNLDLAKATDLSRVAQDSAVISGRNSTEVLGDLVHGITTQNSLVLRNAGINVQAGAAMDTYAKSIGKSTKELTDSERSQAVLNAVIAAGVPIAGAYAAAMEEPGKVLRSFPRVFDDIKVAVGESLVTALGPFILKLYDLAKAISSSLAPGGALREVADSIGAALGRLVEPITKVVGHLSDWIKKVKPGQFDGFTKVFESIGPAAAGAGAGIFTMGAKSLPVIGNLLGGINPLVVAFGALALTSPAVQKEMGELFKALAPVAQEVLPKLIQGFQEVVAALAPVIAEMAKVAVIGLAQVLLAIVDPVVALAKFLTPLAPVIITVGVAMKIASVAMGILSAATAAFGVTLHVSTGGILLIVGAIVALVSGLVLAYQKVDWFRAAVDAVASPIAELARMIWGFINGTNEATKKLGPFAVVLEGLINPIRGVIDIVKGLIQIVTGVFAGDWDKAWEGLKLVVEGFLRYMFAVPMALITNFGPPVLDFFAGLGKQVVDALASFASGVADFFTGLWNTVSGAVTGFAGEVVDFFSKIPGWAVDALKALPGLLSEALQWAIAFMIVGAYYAITGLWKFFTEIVPTAIGYLRDLGPKLKDVATSAITSMVNGFTSAAVAVWNFFIGLPARILGYLTTAGTWLLDTGKTVLTGLYNGIVDGAVAIWNFFTGLPARIKGYFTSAISWLTGSGKQVSDGMASGVVSGGTSMWDWFRDLPRKVLSFVTGAPMWLYNIGRDMIQGLINGITSMAGNIGGAIGNIVSGGINKAKSILGIGSPSRVFAGIGKDLGRGLVGGIEAMIPVVGHAMEDMLALPTTPTVDLGLAGGGGNGLAGLGGPARNYTLNIYPQVADAESVAAGFRRLELIGGIQ